MDIITYESLYEILRKEKYSNELQTLPKTFFQDVINYLEEKQNILKSQEKKESIFSTIETEKTKKQVENIKKIIKELYERRERKIIELALFLSRTDSKLPSTQILDEEKPFFEEVLASLNIYRKSILTNTLNLKPPEIEKKPKELKTNQVNSKRLVRFIQAVPKFIDQDLKIYGPFEEQDIANLPSDIADILIKNKKAETIEAK